jgi:hypothetical protein
MSIKISTDDVKFMLDKLDALPPDLRLKLRPMVRNGGILSADDADRLRDVCGDRLQTHGFDRNYDLTVEGRSLELLIDKLFVGVKSSQSSRAE